MKLPLVVAVALVAMVGPSIAQGKGNSSGGLPAGNSGHTINPGPRAGTTFSPGNSGITVNPGIGKETVAKPVNPAPSKR